MEKISKKVRDQVTAILPDIREELKAEFAQWVGGYTETKNFYSDKKLFETLPCAVYEYVIIDWGVDPKLVSPDSAIKLLNGKILKDISKITAHALRRLACNK